MNRPAPALRASFHFFRDIPTRWLDNDIYGHVNNVVYYSYFDTVIAHFLMEHGGLDPFNPDTSPVVGFAVETSCRFHKPIAFPDLIVAGLRTRRLSERSSTYEIGIFRGDDEIASADGQFVHVWVDKATGRSAPIPAQIRTALATILVA
ncbi:MAG: acyl-CoA thioesterase [Geminicoccaceae bacterium]